MCLTFYFCGMIWDPMVFGIDERTPCMPVFFFFSDAFESVVELGPLIQFEF